MDESLEKEEVVYGRECDLDGQNQACVISTIARYAFDGFQYAHLKDYPWDYVIIDEAHLINNDKKGADGLRLRDKNRAVRLCTVVFCLNIGRIGFTKHHNISADKFRFKLALNFILIKYIGR